MSDVEPNAGHQHYIVLANPSPQGFDHAIARSYVEEVKRQGQGAEILDLYGIGFDPVLRDQDRPDRRGLPAPWIEAELERLRNSSVVVLVYPIWFGGAPAILKGYVDRVMGAGCDFRRFREGAAQPALRGKWLLTFTTSGTPMEWLQEHGQPHSMRQGWDMYLERGFGMRDAGHVSIDNVMPGMNSAYVREQLDRVQLEAGSMCGRLSADGDQTGCE